MKIEQLQKEKDGKIVLKIEKCPPSFANMLRREIMENVPTMAIEEVEFKDNNSALYDEVFAHRLGLIPLTTDLKSYILPSECKCEGEGCARCQLKMTLKVNGPGNVYASDFNSKDPKIKPAFPKMLLVKLIKGQKVELEATATLGQGKDHSKFSPGLAFYHIAYSFNQKKNIENAEEVAKKCPKGVFKAEKNKLVPQDETKSYLWDTCLNFVKDEIEVKPTEDIIFTLESWGQLSPKDIMVQACDGFIEQLDEFEKVFK